MESPNKETSMKALTDFLTTDYGLMSAIVLALCVLGIGYFANYVRKHIKEDAARAMAAGNQTRGAH